MALRPIAKKLRIVGGFGLSIAEFTGIRFNVDGQSTLPTGVAFSPDGARMFVTGRNSDSVFEYDLTTGFDVSTASFSGTSFDISGQMSDVSGVAFSPDGARMFVIGGDVSETVFQYSLNTGFDLSTASFSGISFNVDGQSTLPTDVAFNPDGTRMFIVSDSAGGSVNASKAVIQYSLSTGFDLSTVSFSGTSFDISGQATKPTGVAFNPDGSRMFVIGADSDSMFEYSLSVAFDVSTASFSGTTFDVSGQTIGPTSVAFNPDGTRMFVIGQTSDFVFEYLVGRLTLQD